MAAGSVVLPIAGTLMIVAPAHAIGWRTAECRSGSQAITVVNEAAVPVWYLSRVERAVARQSAQVSAAWRSPCAVFVKSGGWPIYLRRGVLSVCPGDLGCHDTTPAGYVSTSAESIDLASHRVTPQPWSEGVSHEVIEMLVDPYEDRYLDGQLVEVCDPVDIIRYRRMGVWLQDFALPEAYAPHARGRLDFLHVLQRDGSISATLTPRLQVDGA